MLRASTTAGSKQVARGGPAPVRLGQADRGHARSRLLAQPRHPRMCTIVSALAGRQYVARVAETDAVPEETAHRPPRRCERGLTAVRAAATLHRPRRRPGGAPRGRDAGGSRQCGRHRGPRAHAALGRLQHRPHRAGRRGPRGVSACAARTRGRDEVPGHGPSSGPMAASARARAGSVLADGRARPSRWRWCGSG
jgi:hypothetical protein